MQGHVGINWRGQRSLLVGAQAQILGNGVQHIAVACRLLSDVELDHAHAKALNLCRTPEVQHSVHWQCVKGLSETQLARTD